MRLWSPHGAPASLDRCPCHAWPVRPAWPATINPSLRQASPPPVTSHLAALGFCTSGGWQQGAQAGNLDRAVKGPACIGQNLKPGSIHLESKLCAQTRVITLAGLGVFSACFTEPPPLCSTGRRVISHTLTEGTHFAGGCSRGYPGARGLEPF
jgi:hypothetical protein